jgi:DNA-binding CsgD family transcriptional regulator
MARALAGEAEAALETFSFLPDAPALVPDSHAEALAARGLLRLWTGDLPGADADLTAVVTRISGGLQLRYPGQALGYLAETAFRLGRWDEARRHAEQAVSQAEDAGRVADLPFAHNLAARIAAFRGEWDLASAHVNCAEQAARGAGTASAERFAASARCVLGLVRDDAAGVLQAATPLARSGESAGLADDPTADLWRPAWIWALIRVGRLDEAVAALNAFEADAAFRGDRAALVHSARLRAGLALTRGEPEQAEAILEACRAVADSLEDPMTRALFDVEYGRCLARAHRRPAALARLRSAHEVLAGLGARPFADAVAAELGALGLRGGPDADSGLASLTTQELQVARLVAGGMSNREAAAQLYLSPKTIEYHLAHIFAKLGIKTRYQLAALVRPAVLRDRSASRRDQPAVLRDQSASRRDRSASSRP